MNVTMTAGAVNSMLAGSYKFTSGGGLERSMSLCRDDISRGRQGRPETANTSIENSSECRAVGQVAHAARSLTRVAQSGVLYEDEITAQCSGCSVGEGRRWTFVTASTTGRRRR